MKSKMFTAIISGLIAVTGIFGMVESTEAKPDGAQRLRGMEDRTFLVSVEIVSSPIPEEVGAVFPNCYFFLADGTWIDPPLLPVLGSWEQHSTGAATSYSASADAGAFVVVQEGTVTPAKGKGVLQLVAVSTIDAFGYEFYSVGFEVDHCPLL